MCVVLDAYSKQDLAIKDPDRKLPFPFLQWSDAGLVIKLPEALARDQNFVQSLEGLVSEKPKPIKETHFGKEFVTQVTVPFGKVKPLVQSLGLEDVTVGPKQFNTVKDFIEVKATQGLPFTDAQKKMLLQ
ncbi:MAG: hypothetical protein WCF65_07190 [Parachlamydiaceae bacterium]